MALRRSKRKKEEVPMEVPQVVAPPIEVEFAAPPVEAPPIEVEFAAPPVEAPQAEVEAPYADFNEPLGPPLSSLPDSPKVLSEAVIVSPVFADMWEPFQKVQMLKGRKTVVKRTSWVQSQITAKKLKEHDYASE